MARTLYRPVKTYQGQQVVTRECDCEIARREHCEGERVHRAYKPVGAGTPDYVCSATRLTVRL